jgi:2-keto-3-deoxy-L-rhamnonate aldolase RhmA
MKTEIRMKNEIRAKLESGANLVGMMHFTGCPMLIEVMASGGMDFVNIDMEHSPIDIGLAAHLIRTADAAGVTPFVRVPSVDPGIIKQVLNLGARGIIIPHADKQSCLDAVKAVRYAPDGIRGSCPAIRASRYTQPDWGAWTRHSNREVTVIPLLEEKEDLEAADAILDIDGIDIVFMGPFDYAVTMGIPGANFDHPVMAGALSRLVKQANQRKKYVMTSVGAKIDAAYAREIFKQGVRLISYSADALVFLEACRQINATRS